MLRCFNTILEKYQQEMFYGRTRFWHLSDTPCFSHVCMKDFLLENERPCVDVSFLRIPELILLASHGHFEVLF